MSNETTSGIKAEDALTMLDNDSLQKLLAQHQAELAALPADATRLQRARLQLEIASDLLALQRRAESWQQARQCFDIFLHEQAWQEAVEACDVIYQSEQADAVVALGQGVWLGVTFPISPQTTIAMLHHIIDETPANADGAAVAAVAAHYIADLRSSDATQRNSLMFLTTQVIAQVAKRHSQIDSQQQLDTWMERLQLNDPAVFLPRLSQVLQAMVEDHWWFDRDKLRKLIPND